MVKEFEQTNKYTSTTDLNLNPPSNNFTSKQL